MTSENLKKKKKKMKNLRIIYLSDEDIGNFLFEKNHPMKP